MIFLKHTLSSGWDVFHNQVIYRFQRKDISRCKMQCVFPTFGFASSAFPLPAFIPPNVSTTDFTQELIHAKGVTREVWRAREKRKSSLTANLAS